MYLMKKKIILKKFVMFKSVNQKIIHSSILVILAFVFVYCSKDGGDSGGENIDSKSIIVNPSSIDFSDTMITKNSAAQTVNVNPITWILTLQLL